MDWFVLYVNSRAEKKVADRLRAKGYEVFCPMKKVLRQWSDRKKLVELPYFSAYVFVRLDISDRIQVLETPGVVNLVYWLKKPAVIRNEEMQSVMEFFESNKQSEITIAPFQEGQEVSIRDGALKDLKGIIIKESKNQLTLEIRQLGLAFKVQVAKGDVEIVNE